MEESPFASAPSSTFDGLAGKNVLVTGGSSGIGQSIAIRFGHEGANVAINYHSDRGEAEVTEEQIQAAYDQCARQIESCGVETSLHQADVSSEDDVAQMFEAAIEELGSVDILVNNAGIQISGASHTLDAADFDKVVAVNLRGAYLCARRALRHWVDAETAGTIINVSSVHQLIPKPKFVGYSASKGGMQNLTRTLALEYADRGIRVNAIGPGATITPINSAWVEDPDKKAMVEDHIPMGRAGRSEEMAAVAAFLASDEAAYVTGQTLYVDGGLTLYPDFRTAWSSE